MSCLGKRFLLPLSADNMDIADGRLSVEKDRFSLVHNHLFLWKRYFHRRRYCQPGSKSSFLGKRYVQPGSNSSFSVEKIGSAWFIFCGEGRFSLVYNILFCGGDKFSLVQSLLFSVEKISSAWFIMSVCCRNDRSSLVQNLLFSVEMIG
jgi:hypothetical protein